MAVLFLALPLRRLQGWHRRVRAPLNAPWYRDTGAGPVSRTLLLMLQHPEHLIQSGICCRLTRTAISTPRGDGVSLAGATYSNLLHADPQAEQHDAG